MKCRLGCIFCKEFHVDFRTRGVLSHCRKSLWGEWDADAATLRWQTARGLICPNFEKADIPWLNKETRELLEEDLTDSERGNYD